jgi:hypothetical protein
MALTPSGAISLGDINTALGRSATASINMNDAQVRFIANQDSGAVSMSNMQNKYNFNGTITVGLSAEIGYDVYGYDSGIPVGSITGGPLWNSRSLDGLISTNIPNASIYTFSGGADFPNLSMRIKVGSNSAIPMTWGSGSTYSNTTTAAITSSDVGSTLNWQFSQTS